MRREGFVHVVKLNVIGNNQYVGQAGDKDVEQNRSEVAITSAHEIQSTGTLEHGVRLETPDGARSNRAWNGDAMTNE